MKDINHAFTDTIESKQFYAIATTAGLNIYLSKRFFNNPYKHYSILLLWIFGIEFFLNYIFIEYDENDEISYSYHYVDITSL